ncbi:MAG: ferritin-like domain-containing protein [Planctomycetia bacterium]|nr:ferritin-like domain-containing protein [Planctomycetia bacterium]
MTLTEQQKNVIEVLNKARAMELHAIMQYMNQHYGLDDDNYVKLAKEMKTIAIDEMRHAEWFAERIHDIHGDAEPTTAFDGNVLRGQEVEEIYGFNADMEADTLVKYNEFLQICRENNDSVTAVLFEKVIHEEQAHFNYFDDTATHIQKLGSSFLARMTDASGA